MKEADSYLRVGRRPVTKDIDPFWGPERWQLIEDWILPEAYLKASSGCLQGGQWQRRPSFSEDLVGSQH